MGSVPTGAVKGSLVGLWYNLLLLERPGFRYSEDESFCGSVFAGRHEKKELICCAVRNSEA